MDALMNSKIRTALLRSPERTRPPLERECRAPDAVACSHAAAGSVHRARTETLPPRSEDRDQIDSAKAVPTQGNSNHPPHHRPLTARPTSAEDVARAVRQVYSLDAIRRGL